MPQPYGLDWARRGLDFTVRLPERTPFVTYPGRRRVTCVAPSPDPSDYQYRYELVGAGPWEMPATIVARPMQQLTLFDLHPPAPVTRRTRNGPTDARTSREITDRFYSTRDIERYVRRRAEGAD